MADDRKQNLGQQGGMHEDQQGSSHQSPGRNPQDDRSAGRRGGDQRGDQDRERRSGFDPSRGGDGGSYKEGGQNEQTRR